MRTEERSIVKKEAAGCYETVVPIYETTRRHIPEASELNNTIFMQQLLQYCPSIETHIQRNPSLLANFGSIQSRPTYTGGQLLETTSTL
jgi:hypothetical protein